MKGTKYLARWLTLIIIALVFALPTTAQEAAANPDAVEGATLYEAGDYEGAVALLQRAAFADPTDTETLRRYLDSLVYTGQFADVEYPANLLRLQDPTAFTELGVAAAQRAQAASDDVQAAIAAAFFAVENGDSTQQEAIDRIFALEPDNAFGHDMLAYVGFYSEYGENGREAAERALELAADNPQIIVDLALPFAWALDDPDRAAELLTQAIALDPTLAQAYHTRATVYGEYLGDAAAALSDIEHAIELAPGNFMYRNHRGWIHQYEEQYTQAYDNFAYVLSVFPASPSAMFGLLSSAIASERDAQPFIDTRDLVEADAVLTVDSPYAGEMVSNRIVRLPAEGEPRTYTITVHAVDPMTLDPMMFIVNGEGTVIALNDDIDGTGDRANGAFNSQITGPAEAGESYTIYILHSGSGSEGEFTVRLEPASEE